MIASFLYPSLSAIINFHKYNFFHYTLLYVDPEPILVKNVDPFTF